MDLHLLTQDSPLRNHLSTSNQDRDWSGIEAQCRMLDQSGLWISNLSLLPSSRSSTPDSRPSSSTSNSTKPSKPSSICYHAQVKAASEAFAESASLDSTLTVVLGKSVPKSSSTSNKCHRRSRTTRSPLSMEPHATDLGYIGRSRTLHTNWTRASPSATPKRRPTHPLHTDLYPSPPMQHPLDLPRSRTSYTLGQALHPPFHSLHNLWEPECSILDPFACHAENDCAEDSFSEELSKECEEDDDADVNVDPLTRSRTLQAYQTLFPGAVPTLTLASQYSPTDYGFAKAEFLQGRNRTIQHCSVPEESCHEPGFDWLVVSHFDLGEEEESQPIHRSASLHATTQPKIQPIGQDNKTLFSPLAKGGSRAVRPQAKPSTKHRRVKSTCAPEKKASRHVAPKVLCSEGVLARGKDSSAVEQGFHMHDLVEDLQQLQVSRQRNGSPRKQGVPLMQIVKDASSSPVSFFVTGNTSSGAVLNNTVKQNPPRGAPRMHAMSQRKGNQPKKSQRGKACQKLFPQQLNMEKMRMPWGVWGVNRRDVSNPSHGEQRAGRPAAVSQIPFVSCSAPVLDTENIEEW